jgi:two-component system nitrate/nitrite sensor histidine kinase NarX
MHPRRRLAARHWVTYRWLAVAAALVFIGAVEVLSDSVFDALLPFPRDTIFVLGAVATVAIIAARYAFRVIDGLTGDLVERNDDLAKRNAVLAAVYDVSLAVSGQADPETVLAAIVDHARDLLGVDAALLALCGPADELRLRAASARPGVLAAALAESRAVGPVRAAGGTLATAGELGRYLGPGYAVGLEAPIMQGADRVGILGVVTAEPRAYSPSDVEALRALATQVGLALEAERLRDELRALAVQGERERIAREMHDGLAQVLGYVNTKSQAVEELLAAERVQEARKQLSELAGAARSVYVDVREAILNLSPPPHLERGLTAALEDYAAKYAESSKLAVRFKATPEAREALLSPEVQAEVFGVAREALTNTRKHARAHRVTVALAREGADLTLRITDDGVGFDTESVGTGPERWPHFGLAGMRERAAAVGGSVTWRSSPGSGSEIELHVPVVLATSIGGFRPHVSSGAPAGSATDYQASQSPAPTHIEAK